MKWQSLFSVALGLGLVLWSSVVFANFVEAGNWLMAVVYGLVLPAVVAADWITSLARDGDQGGTRARWVAWVVLTMSGTASALDLGGW